MKSKSLILIAIALGCGLVASIGISQVMGRSQNTEPAEAAQIETATVAVASKDLDIGATFSSDNVKVEKWPAELAPEGAIADIASLEGKYPRVRVTKGQPVMMSMLMDSLDKKIIPEGYRVIPIKVSADTISGLVLPGDRVDVLVLLKQSKEVKKTVARTVLQDVRIFDVNSQTERIVEEGQVTNVKTVSLLLTPSKVALITLAQDMGKLRLALRRHSDTVDAEYKDAVVGDMLGTTAEEGSREIAADKLDDLLVQPEPTVTPVTVTPKHEMVLITPGGMTEYSWTDFNKPPRVTELGKGSASALPELGIPALSPEAAVAGDGESKTQDEEPADE